MTRLDTPFDPDTDLDALLAPAAWERTLLRPPKADSLPRADLEAIAQQVAKRLGKAVPAAEGSADALGRHRPGPRGPRPGPRHGGHSWRGRGSWRGPWMPWVNEEEVAVPELSDADTDVEGTPAVWSGRVVSADGVRYRMRTRLRGTARAVLLLDGQVALLDADGLVRRTERPLARLRSLGTEGSPNEKESSIAPEPKGLLNVFDPRHNLREIAKEFLLLEDHLAQPAKHCPDCIRKHLLKGEALAEEAVQLDRDGSQNARLSPLPGQIRNLQRAFLADTDRIALQQDVRTLRKQLSKESFDALDFKPSKGSPNRAERVPVTFALERDRDAQQGSRDEAVASASLPSIVVATLRRRVAAGLDGNPAPILYRERTKDGIVVSAGLATGTRGEGELIVQTREAKPRTIFVPISDAVLDLSRDTAFRSLPWPASIPLTRSNGKVETFALTPGTRVCQNIRVIASVLWPVVDSFALRYVGTEPGAREAILQRLLVAAVVNAIYESGLDAGIEGDKGRAVGLFQLRDDGAGQGMSKDDRKDPFLNTARIAQRFMETRKFFGPLGEAEKARARSTSPAAWTGLFARFVEAPSDKETAERVRGDSAAAGFVRDLPPVIPVVALVPRAEPDPEQVWPWVLGGIGVAAVGVGLAVKWSRG